MGCFILPERGNFGNKLSVDPLLNKKSHIEATIWLYKKNMAHCSSSQIPSPGLSSTFLLLLVEAVQSPPLPDNDFRAYQPIFKFLTYLIIIQLFRKATQCFCQWRIQKIVKGEQPQEGAPSYLKGARSEGRNRSPGTTRAPSVRFFVDIFGGHHLQPILC